MEKSKQIFSRVEIVSNIEIPGSKLKLLTFFEPTIALTGLPGQFVELGIPGCILPKPFGIMNTQKFGLVEILYQIVGKGTETLSKMNEGETITVLGPLGNGFTLPDSKNCYLVGGGTGIAPVLFLSNYLKDKIDSTLYLGGRSKDFLPGINFLPDNSEIATDDGSAGFYGNVIELMQQKLIPPAPVFACGPKPMLKALWGLVKEWDTQVEFSLEAYMGCGIGACLGCQIQTKSGQKHVCVDGPVFPASEVSDVF